MASHLPRITVLGSLNTDLVSYVPHHPLPGETLTSNSFAVSSGGKGANQAVACAKLSRPRSAGPGAAASSGGGVAAEVAMVGCVGQDSFGAQLRDGLAAYGVDVTRVEARSGQQTGVAVIVVDEPTGQNRIIHSPLANHALRPEDFPGGGGALAAALGGRPDLLVMQLEIPLDTVLQALRAAREAGIPALLNPAPAVPLPDDALAGLAHLVVNETEAATLGGCDERVLDAPEGLGRVAAGFVRRGVENVVITLGGRGVYYMSRDGPSGLVPALEARVVDTTAAGDTFVGQYALEAVTEPGFDIAAAVAKANRAAAKTVERLGAQDSIPWRDELDLS